MSSVVATVKSIVGQVFVISPEGARRVLVEGDRLFAGDQIDTGLSGAVSLELADGRIQHHEAVATPGCAVTGSVCAGGGGF